MSARAYRINSIEYQDNASFNLWHCPKFMEFLTLYEVYGVESGVIEIPLEAIKKAIKQAKKLEILEYKEELIQDIKEAETKEKDYISYMVY